MAIGLIESSILATGLAVPVCVGVVWLGMRRLKRKLYASDISGDSV